MTGDRLTPEQRRRVERSTKLVERLARSMIHKLGGVTEDDLRSVGYEALTRCGLRYDPQMGIPFGAFAHYRVKGAMIDAARRATPAVRQRSRALRAMAATQALLERAHAAQPTTGPDPRTLQQKVTAAADLIAQATTAVMLANVGPVQPDRVVDPSTHAPEQVLHDARMRDRIREVVDRYDEDERAIIWGLYDEGLSMTELGARLGRDKSTISRRHASLLRRISEDLRESDVAR